MDRPPDVFEILSACLAKGQQLGLASLSPTERTVYLVHWLQFEVDLGGLPTFYYNSSGDFSPEMVGALRQIGAQRAADALARANAVLQADADVWPDRETRFEALRQGDRTAWREFEDQLDSDHPTAYPGLLENYVRANASRFSSVKSGEC